MIPVEYFMVLLSEKEWNLYLKKYKNLMWKISHMISGDPTISNLEDNYSDIVLAALESIKGFHKKTGMNFEEMMKTKYFDQYTKTCLWTAKARKGNSIKKNYPVTNKKVALDYIEDSDSTSTSGVADAANLEDRKTIQPELAINFFNFIDSFSEEDSKILDIISESPEVFSGSGKLKIRTLAKKSKLSVRKIQKIIDNLKRKVNYDIEN